MTNAIRLPALAALLLTPSPADTFFGEAEHSNWIGLDAAGDDTPAEA